MSRKFKKLVRSVSEKSGVSHAGAVNLLRRGNPAPVRALDPVLIRSGAKALAGKHTHEAGVVSAVLDDGDVMVTPAEPRSTQGGISFWRHEEPARYSAADVRHFPLKKGERFARFVEDVFDVRLCFSQSSDEPVLYGHNRPAMYENGTPLHYVIMDKPVGKTSYVIGEEGESILAIAKPRRVIIPLWKTSADFLDNDRIVGFDAVKIRRAVRDRMLALIDASNFVHDLLAAGPDCGPRGEPVHLSSPPDGAEWYVADLDDHLSPDCGMLLDAPPLHSPFRYGCGRGKIGRWVSGPTFSGLYLCEGETSVVSPRTCRACRSPLRPENLRIADGCPCNSPRGVNHGLVPTDTCTCPECDPAQTGSTRYSAVSGP